MTHHRKLAIQPKSERDILAAVFKNDPVNKGGKMNDGRNKPSSAFPVDEGNLKGDHSKERVSTVSARHQISPEAFKHSPGNKDGVTNDIGNKPSPKDLPSDGEHKISPRLKQPTKILKNSPGDKKDVETSTNTDQITTESSPLKVDNPDHHKLAGLSCAKYGGPSDESANEMVYWSDIPSDSSYASPFKKKAPNLRGKKMIQYMTFEPDEGGWNNIRCVQ